MKPKLTFYDIYTQRKFTTDLYDLKEKNGRYKAVVYHNGHEHIRFVSEQFYHKHV